MGGTYCCNIQGGGVQTRHRQWGTSVVGGNGNDGWQQEMGQVGSNISRQTRGWGCSLPPHIRIKSVYQDRRWVAGVGG